MLTSVVNIAVFAVFRCGSDVVSIPVLSSSGFAGFAIAKSRQKWQRSRQKRQGSRQKWQGWQGCENEHRGHGGTRRLEEERRGMEAQGTQGAQRIQDEGMEGRTRLTGRVSGAVSGWS